MGNPGLEEFRPFRLSRFNHFFEGGLPVRGEEGVVLDSDGSLGFSGVFQGNVEAFRGKEFFGTFGPFDNAGGFGGVEGPVEPRNVPALPQPGAGICRDHPM